MISEILGVDLSGLAHTIFHVATTEPDPDYVSRAVVDRVRKMASSHPYTVVLTDCGRSFRRELSADYKADRPERNAVLGHQIEVAIETLKGDGFQVWAVKGLEADDLAASLVAKAMAHDSETTVLLASDDHDWIQLVGDRVRIQRLRNGDIYDPAAIVSKFNVKPSQFQDYLALTGDASDNIKGAANIGPKTAVELLTRFGSIDAMYAAAAKGAPEFLSLTNAKKASLIEYEARYPLVRKLIQLRDDAPIDIEAVFRDRVPLDAPDNNFITDAELQEIMPDTPTEPADLFPPEPTPTPSATETVHPIAHINTATGEIVTEKPKAEEQKMAVIPQEPDVLAPVSTEWNQQLEPRSIREAQALSKWMHESRLFLGAYGNSAAVLATILAGRELGLQAMASLRAFHVIDGKATLSADLIRALVMKSPNCLFFRCVERTAERATFKTQRKGDPEMELSYSIDEAKMAWSKGDDAWKKSAWGKFPSDMLVARASSKLARLVYAPEVMNLYCSEEFDETR